MVEDGIAGVLALLLGFTVSMAVTRFEVRKQLLLQEANAIGTACLSTQLLPAPESTEIADLLREYMLSGSNTLMPATTLIGSVARVNKPQICRMNFGPGPLPMGRRNQTQSKRDYSCNP